MKIAFFVGETPSFAHVKAAVEQEFQERLRSKFSGRIARRVFDSIVPFYAFKHTQVVAITKRLLWKALSRLDQSIVLREISRISPVSPQELRDRCNILEYPVQHVSRWHAYNGLDWC